MTCLNYRFVHTAITVAAILLCCAGSNSRNAHAFLIPTSSSSSSSSSTTGSIGAFSRFFRCPRICETTGSCRLQLAAGDDDGESNDQRSPTTTTTTTTSNNPRQRRHALSPRTARLKMPLNILLSLQASSSILTFLPPEPSHAATAAASKSATTFDSSLKEFFPGSIPSSTVLLRVQSTLRKRQYLPYNTILASSIPNEEILSTPISLMSILRNKLCESKDGGIYSLGGLGGIPFAGDRGMEDLFLHAPQDGRIVIVFGPNIGIDKNGVLGQVERIGIEGYGAGAVDGEEANGVVVRAYKDIMKSGKEEGMNASSKSTAATTGWNLEYDYIVSLLQKMPLQQWANDKSKGGDDYAIAQMTKEIYGIMEDLIQKMVQRCMTSDDVYTARVTEVTLMGGIFINRGHGSGTEGGDDYFQPLYMKALAAKNGGMETDLYKQVFGDLSTPRN
jgi:hypothetical protein